MARLTKDDRQRIKKGASAKLEASLKEARDSVSLIMYNAVRESYPEVYKWVSTAEENGWYKALNEASAMFIAGRDGRLIDIFPYSMHSGASDASYTYGVTVPEGKHIVYPFKAVEETPALREALDAEGKKIQELISRINDVGRLVDSVRTAKQLLELAPEFAPFIPEEASPDLLPVPLELVASVRGIMNGYSDASVNN